MALDMANAVSKLRSLTGKFDKRVKSTAPYYPTLCTVIPSDGFDEEYGLLGAVPSVREWIGDRQFKDPRALNFTIVNKHWESGIKIDKNRMKDDRMGIYVPMFESLGVKAARYPDTLLLGNVMKNADTLICLDGQNFFDTDHVWGKSGTQSNDLAFDVADPNKPTVDELQDALDAMLHQMMSFKDDEGDFFHDDAVIGFGDSMQLEVVCPLKYRKTMLKAVTSGITVNGGDTNVVITDARVVGTPHFDGNFFDLYRTDVPFKPYIFQTREPITRQIKGMDDHEFKDAKFMTEQRNNIGLGAWWDAVRATLS